MMRLIRLLATLSIVSLATACAKQVDQSKFANLYHAGQAIKTSTSIGVTNNKYTTLLQTFATEVSVAKEKRKNPVEQRMVNYYILALKSYKVAANDWSVLIKYGDYEGAMQSGMHDAWRTANANIKKAGNLYLHRHTDTTDVPSDGQ